MKIRAKKSWLSPAQLFVLLAALVAVTVTAACDTSSPSGSREVTVFAASSLTEVFGELAEAFEDEHRGTQVTLNFAGSTTLRAQLDQGAQADVFASADEAQMDLAVRAGVVEGASRDFATNSLGVVKPAGDGAVVNTLEDLASLEITLVLALPNVPVGSYSRQSLEKLNSAPGLPADYSARVLANLVSEEGNVRQVLAKVALGEADAGITYTTDITPDVADDVATVEIPDEYNVVALYPIAALSVGSNPGGGADFVDFVLSEAGQRILADFGFGAAPS